MARFSALQFLRDQRKELPGPESYKTDLTGKTVIVTGANVGLGLEAARHLARMSPGKLILACRDTKRGAAALESIVKDTQCSSIEVWALDLASFESIKAFADKYERECGVTLDLLIENAGMSTLTFSKTPQDGWETTLQVNHLGTALLALRLLPFLLSAHVSMPTPRLVIVASEAHYLAKLPEAKAPNLLQMLNDEKYSNGFGVMLTRYNVTKLLNVLFTRGLASRLPPSTPLTVNCVNPGLCHSALTRERNIINLFVPVLKALLSRTTEVGSRTIVHAALSPALQGVTGQYLNACEVNEPSDLVIGESGKALEDRIWNETLEVLSHVDPRVPEIVQQYLA